MNENDKFLPKPSGVIVQISPLGEFTSFHKQYPPTVLIHMVKDHHLELKVKQNFNLLTANGTPARMYGCRDISIHSSFFSSYGALNAADSITLVKSLEGIK